MGAGEGRAYGKVAAARTDLGRKVADFGPPRCASYVCFRPRRSERAREKAPRAIAVI